MPPTVIFSAGLTSSKASRVISSSFAYFFGLAFGCQKARAFCSFQMIQFFGARLRVERGLEVQNSPPGP